jgi:hypothetical protein
MSYLFIKNLFQREKFVLFFHKKKKNLKKQKKNIFSGFFRWVFLVFFWVGFLLPTLLPGPPGRRERGLPGHLLLGRPLPDGAAAGLVHPGGDHYCPGRHAHRAPRTPPLLQVNNMNEIYLRHSVIYSRNLSISYNLWRRTWLSCSIRIRTRCESKS